MKIYIKQPFSLNEIGGRANNEDKVFPPVGKTDGCQHLFMVCDGVGGTEKGEIASSLAVESLSSFFLHNPYTGIHQMYLNDAVQYTQQQFDRYLEEYPIATGMATTLTLLFFSDYGAILAHIGDSRIYHVRSGKILFQTEDHSLVNALVMNKIITREEALTHPQKNVITRAIQGNSVGKTEPEVHVIRDVLAGDYFFLCSDGILEKISDELLCKILSNSSSNEEKIREIYNLCQNKTRDNFSAYLIQIEKVIPSPSRTIARPAILKMASAGFKGYHQILSTVNHKLLYGLTGIIAIIILFIIFLISGKNSSETESKKEIHKPEVKVPRDNNLRQNKKPSSESTHKLSPSQPGITSGTSSGTESESGVETMDTKKQEQFKNNIPVSPPTDTTTKKSDSL